MLHNAGGVVQIPHGRFAITAGLNVHHMHSGPGGAVMYFLFGEVQIVFRVARVQGDFAIGFGQHIFDQGPRVTQSAIVTKNSAGANHDINA